MAGRRIDAEIVDNEIIGPTQLMGSSEGIRLANMAGADGGVIVAKLSDNRVHGFQLGCIVANNRSNNGVVQVRSSGDRFFANAHACDILGGLVTQATGERQLELDDLRGAWIPVRRQHSADRQYGATRDRSRRRPLSGSGEPHVRQHGVRWPLGIEGFGQPWA
jgi:hypothetical protein